MTMHKAKGLTASAVILIAAEDEYIPGGQTGEKEGDERRLLYVSLSRARHFLAVTYCEYRTGYQMYTGRTSGSSRRTLTRFLRDAPIAPIDGASFVEQLEA
jgi:DNA helicase-2/ATP-dependent DNA helicase PcrA